MDKITIAVGNSANETYWRNEEYTWTELVELFKDVRKTSETMAQYDAMEKADQNRAKNGKAFVGGKSANGERKKADIIDRRLIILDVDYASKNTVEDIAKALSEKAYFLYQTHSHRENEPRYRLVIPVDRSMTPDEYAPASRKVASLIGIHYFDRTTHDINRLFYFPSCSADVDTPFFYEGRGTLSSVNKILAMYDNWKDHMQWARHPNEDNNFRKSIEMIKDPRTKTGIIGAFCRVYDITGAISEFIPEVYSPTGVGDRWTYNEGSTAGGLATYDNDTFAHSHHESDPISGKTVNAFDLVRLHKFGHLDDHCANIEDIGNLPSFKAMVNFANNISGVIRELANDDFSFDVGNSEKNELPSFPITVFPNWIQNFCNDVAHTQQVPIDMVAMGVLNTFACACMKKITFQVTKTWKQDLNLYTLTLAPSGSNKSGVVSLLRKPIVDYEDEFNESNEAALNTKIYEWEVNEMKLKEIKKKLANPDITEENEQYYTAQMEYTSGKLTGLKPSKLRLLCDDATVEKVAQLMYHNDGKMAIIEPEGHGFFSKLQGQYSNGCNLDLFLKADEDSHVLVDRVNNEREDFKITYPRLTIGLACQPSVVQNLKTELHGTGLFARFLISDNADKFKPRKLVNDKADQTTERQYDRAVKTLLSLKEKVILSLTEDAYAAFELIYNEIQEELYFGDLKDENGKNFGGKFAGRFARVVGLVHIMDSTGYTKIPTEIPLEVVERCKPLVDYFVSHKVDFHAVATESEEEKFYRDVLEKIANFANGEKTVNASSFYQNRMRRKYPKVRQYRELLQAMEEKGLIILHKQPNTRTYEIEISKKGCELAIS